MTKLLLSATLFFFLASLPIGYSFAQDDGDGGSESHERHREDGKSCDNSFERQEADRCKCEHTEKCDPTDPNDVQRHAHMTSKCQNFCHEEKCKCANECNS